MILWLDWVVLCSWKQGRRWRWEKWSGLPLSLSVTSAEDFDARNGEGPHKILGGMHTALGIKLRIELKLMQGCGQVLCHFVEEP